MISAGLSVETQFDSMRLEVFLQVEVLAALPYEEHIVTG